MTIRKEQEIRLRREVSSIVKHHINSSDIISSEDLVNDIMGAVNQEDVYRVKDYQDETDKQREELRAQMQHKDAQSKEELSKLMELLSEKNARIEKLTRMINDDSSKKELEKKLAIAHDKNRALKKLVQLALEEM